MIESIGFDGQIIGSPSSIEEGQKIVSLDLAIYFDLFDYSIGLTRCQCENFLFFTREILFNYFNFEM